MSTDESIEPVDANAAEFKRELEDALKRFRATARVEEMANAEAFMNALAARFNKEAQATKESSPPFG